jgi:hypothetical protein
VSTSSLPAVNHSALLPLVCKCEWTPVGLGLGIWLYSLGAYRECLVERERGTERERERETRESGICHL